MSWHLAGIMAMGCAAVVGIGLWVATERGSLKEPVTTGIAPASQSGKPLLIK